MKNITLSADEHLIEAARERARREHTTLNNEFRHWLESYVGQEEKAELARTTLQDLRGKVRIGRKLTREEMNER
ncbi:MAG: hypothetical protein ACOCZ2_04665 [Thermodesulfobacteriota bacterium]